MSQSGPKPSVGILLRRKHGISARADIEWERIMVQITFAFVIILGYLISVEMHEARQLAAESQRYQKANAALESIVASFRGSEIGEERAKRLAAEKELQLQKLLIAWSRVNDRRELHLALQQFRHAELVPLAGDLESLPVGEDFESLKREVDRVFLSESGDVSTEEVIELVAQAIATAGFDSRSLQTIRDEGGLSPEAVELYADTNVVTAPNRRTLTLQIAGDLAEERKNLALIQYALVGKIARTRLEKLAALPLDPTPNIDLSSADLGAEMLDQILRDLATTMRLLPETADMIRGDDVAEPDGE